jgi:chorismate mutase
MYFDNLLPRFAKEGSDGNCGSSAVCDTMCLQVIKQFLDHIKICIMKKKLILKVLEIFS